MAKNESKTEMGQAQENTKAPAYTAQELADGCGAFTTTKGGLQIETAKHPLLLFKHHKEKIHNSISLL